MLPRVVILRTRQQASVLAARVEAMGAEAVLIPAIEIAPPSTFEQLDASLRGLGGFDWVIFTSANAVRAFAERAAALGIAAGAGARRIAAIGPATATAIIETGLVLPGASVLVPETFVAESLAARLLAEAAGPGQRYLLVRAEQARDIVPAELEEAGHSVVLAPAYRNVAPDGAVAAMRAAFAVPENCPQIAAFTSSSTVRNFFALLEQANVALPSGLALVSIGPVTSATLREFGHEPDGEATEATVESLAAAIGAQIERFLASGSTA